MYLMLEMILSLFAAVVKALLRVDLEPQFNEPCLATSLQHFWGRRWNLMVPNILHPTVYRPVGLSPPGSCLENGPRDPRGFGYFFWCRGLCMSSSSTTLGD
ncbi:hypothetical protein AAHA92_05083 [Salvia divinorum]|uniref:Wax synthase domain-containing protein n=1 Tax=Salvia divinorum TaxID=28513 RepID=A0ABD1I4I5_SALDI